MRALLALYQSLRTAITDAIATMPGTDPDRASYQIAVQTAQMLVTGAATSSPAQRTWPATLAGPSWPACTGHAGHASAPAGSNRRSAAGPGTRPASPGPT